MIIGAMPDLEFQKAAHIVEGPNRLYIFSDGVYEVPRPDGKMRTFDEFVDFMTLPSAPDQSPMDRLLSQAREYNKSENLPDDFSILEVLLE